MAERKEIKVGISGCLHGQNVRYDGSHKLNAVIVEFFNARVQLIPYCPEVAIGLGTPRPPIQLVEVAGEVRAQGVDDSTLDPTLQLREYGRQIARQLTDFSGFIFKARSPSCGVGNVKILRYTGEERHPDLPSDLLDSGLRRNDEMGEEREERGMLETGSGLFAAEIIKAYPGLPVAQETDLETAEQCEAFLQQVVRYNNALTPSPFGRGLG